MYIQLYTLSENDIQDMDELDDNKAPPPPPKAIKVAGNKVPTGKKHEGRKMFNNGPRCDAITKAGNRCKQQSDLVKAAPDGKNYCGVHHPDSSEKMAANRSTYHRKKRVVAHKIDESKLDGHDHLAILLRPTNDHNELLEQYNALMQAYMAHAEGDVDNTTVKNITTIMLAKERCMDNAKKLGPITDTNIDDYSDYAKKKILTFVEEFPDFALKLGLDQDSRMDMFTNEYAPELERNDADIKEFEEGFLDSEEIDVSPSDAFADKEEIDEDTAPSK